MNHTYKLVRMLVVTIFLSNVIWAGVMYKMVDSQHSILEEMSKPKEVKKSPSIFDELLIIPDVQSTTPKKQKLDPNKVAKR